jgi:hypothetical protein
VNKYRRIEINAYRRRVTVVSGERGSGASSEEQPAETDEGVDLYNADACEPVAPDSPEGQLILVEAMRSLERRLLPQARAIIVTDQCAQSTNSQKRNHFLSKARSLCRFVCPNAFRSVRKEK